MPTKEKLRVAQFGFGAIGQAVTRLLVRKQSVELVGCVDADPAKIGRPVQDWVAEGPADLRIYGSLEELLTVARPQVVIHTTQSSLRAVAPQLRGILTAGIPCISSTEELFFPPADDPILQELDQLARRTGVTLIGAGVNPGFVMDTLPVFLTTVSAQVDAVHVVRRVDASRRRLPLIRKIGVGMHPEELQSKLTAGVMGHIGLPESLRFLADRLHLAVERVEHLRQPVVAEAAVTAGSLRVEPGQCLGIYERCVGYRASRVILSLELTMAVGLDHPYDEVRIEGDPPLHVRIEGGVQGDTATAAVLVNLAPVVARGEPGWHDPSRLLRLATVIP